MKVLVLTSEPIGAAQLREALRGEVDPQDVEVLVVAPALQESGLKFWLSDADDAIARAQEVWRETVGSLDEAGMRASGDTGESDPVNAIQDALQTFDAERIVVFTHSDGEQRYREGLDPREIQERFGVSAQEAQLSR